MMLLYRTPHGAVLEHEGKYVAVFEEWDALLCTAHFPEPFGHLRREDGGRVWSPE